MFNKPFDQIDLQDIQDLVQIRKERENNHLEYKRELGNSDRDKKEFLKDVSGFANATGGFLIMGIEETDGKPDQICGTSKIVGNQKVDEWINNVLISNIDEKIRYEIKVLDLPGDQLVVVLHIPESLKKPHMVTYDKRNTYYIRHNTSVNAATQSEVRDMFGYSRRNRDKFEEFLKERNLIDEIDERFGIHENSMLLFNNRTNDIGIKTPFILYSFIPRYLEDNRINTISHDFLDWLYKKTSGFSPFQHVRLFDANRPLVGLYGITFPRIISSDSDENLRSYFEVINNGFIEYGISRDVFYTSKEGKPVLNLTASIGYAWTLFQFAREFYQRIHYYDEVVFQMTVVNVKGFSLCGFGRKNQRTKWEEPFSLDYEDPSFCRHQRFKILEKFIVNELSDDSIEILVFTLAESVSRAFGEMVVKCFDDSGNFNTETMRHFFQ